MLDYGPLLHIMVIVLLGTFAQKLDFKRKNPNLAAVAMATGVTKIWKLHDGRYPDCLHYAAAYRTCASDKQAVAKQK